MLKDTILEEIKNITNQIVLIDDIFRLAEHDMLCKLSEAKLALIRSREILIRRYEKLSDRS